ncbi:MAG: FAD:protein FMN transferase [Clostridia bacterium]|nr:FAD:protein FMN transferase [Clostridia bacterium]
MKKRHISGIAALLLIISLVSCSTDGNVTNPKSKNRIYYDYFDTVSVIYDYSGSSDEEFTDVCYSLTGLMRTYHELFDIYNTYEGIVNIAYLNSMAGRGAVSVPDELIDFLEYCKDIYEKTDGYVNIAMGAVLSLWHDARTLGNSDPSNAALPDSAALAEAAKHCDIGDLVINREAGTVELRDPEMSLDVGAVAKGYAVERLADFLHDNGYNSYALDIGGNLRVVGTKPDGTGWQTGVKNPDLTGGYVHTFELSDGSAVTSGGYERYYIVDGRRYHHIIDKDTAMPAEHFASVTVVCEDSGLADALSTALFCMDIDAGRSIASALGVRDVIWVELDGTVKRLK